MAPFNPDWSELKATQQSLREHMALLKAAQESEQRFREQVAAAMRELRAEMFNYAPVAAIDAAIAALGLGGIGEREEIR